MSEVLIIKLDHEHTPLFLRLVHRKIQHSLLDIDTFSQEFAYLAELRHRIVIRQLGKLSGEAKQAFAEKEVDANNVLEERTSCLLNEAKSEVIQFKRNEAAVKRYK